MLFSTDDIVTLFPNTQGAVREQIPIHQVTTDSRVPMKYSLFIPLKGDKFNGHEFLDQAISNGAIAAIWDKNEPIPRFVPTDFPIFFVDNTLHALQQLANDYRKKIDPTVIGVTGSNGKTTTKDIITTVLAKKFRTHQTKGNLNNHIGLPLTILNMPTDTEVLIVEMGMNHFGEIHVLSKIALPDYAVITNIGESHIEYLKTRAGIAKAKAEILDGLSEQGTLYVDGDEPLLEPYLKQINNKSIGFSSESYQIQDTKVTSTGTKFVFENQSYSIPLLGKHHAKNASYAIALANDLGLDYDSIQSGLINIKMTGMRFESLQGMHGSTVINDTYNASPTSVRAAIDVVKEMDFYQKKVLVLGDMFELGDHAKAYHQEVADSITEDIQFVCTIGEYTKEINEKIKKSKPTIKAKHFLDKEELVSYLIPLLDETTLLLLKASRGMKLEEVCKNVVLH
ncbi:UDP-N-acetylmuramoyl-tripeptide--D-alanyl-D-alanine ligase [Paraliobacillus sp. PM-2]|uniref:UDP-N-acetylmuramoyl-tripeptide--D-alanyl-D- alanine ligase n=1 Tax=Paraliobacillus sp. PM-2 TaxID=1462524 RepID=UPI00061C0472|nr:UDP-N-acetylmuramoyl-tripeptide--D-alanyl-D-alanine ligase [Paraliobacillus sp. PM-2]CQR47793.1 UDP-N-acetylmuramoyl-tripeptide--D-alanyl-D-alanine ligase [Paraliobacillus sp. PM-2]